MSEHQFKIKAILDSQQVQQEIQKLKQQALNAPGSNGAGNVGTVANQQLNNLASTLGKLNASIAALQKSLGALTGSVNKQAAQQAALAPSKSQFLPPIAAIGPGRKQVKSLPQRFFDEIASAVYRSKVSGTMKAPNIGPLAKEWNIDSIWTRPFGAPKFPRISKGPMVHIDIPGIYNPRGVVRRWNNIERILDKEAKAARDKYVQFLNSRKTKVNQHMMNGIRGFAGSYMLGGLAEAGNELTYRDNPVTKPIAAGAGAASQGLNIGATMMMMGMSGPAAGIVGVGAAITEVIKAFGEAKVEKILGVASALQRANSAWEEMYEDFQKWDFSQFKEKISGLDLNNLTGERASARTQYQSDKAEYDAFMSSWASKMSKLDSQYFSGKITADQYALGKEDLNNERDALKEALQKSKDRLDAVNAVYDDHKKALEDFNNVVKQAADFEKRLAEFDIEQTTADILKTEDPEKIKKLMPAIRADIDKANAAMAPIRSQGGLAEYEKETNTYREKLLTTEYGTAEYDSLTEIVKAREEAAKAYKEAAADMMKAVGKSKNLETTIDQLIKQMEDIGRNIKAQQKEVAEYDESAKNKYDQRWGMMSKDQLDASSQKYWSAAGGFKKDYEEALKKASLAKTPEEAKKAMDEAAIANSNWQFNQQQAQSFDQSIVSMLQEKLSDLKAPDMTQVNSLAQNGYMINKSDDEIRWKMQTDYASQQTQLQREIRDKLQSMDSSATFQ